MQVIQRIMTKPSNSSLQRNPFTAYRHPETGEWFVIKDFIKDSTLQSSTEPIKEKDLSSKLHKNPNTVKISIAPLTIKNV
ncbi:MULTISPECIES: hypothetical protein [Spirulina sp. CCY15215]|uniref:hypothetical protein n=1 Tax=Spirulina sp. CCY15215 TaxID=2767591 RepID=UPI00195182C6|nr:hypothetical protein [Spirulina major]